MRLVEAAEPGLAGEVERSDRFLDAKSPQASYPVHPISNGVLQGFSAGSIPPFRGITSMRFRAIVLTTLVFLASGCTADRLRRSTGDQASTMTDFQYQQVLNNLALLSKDPYSLPWHLTIKTGTSQVSDTGTAGLAPGIVAIINTEPILTGSRAVVDQWGTSPVTDDTALQLLRTAYQKAIRPTPGLTRDEVNDLAHTLSAQIGTNSDISIAGEMLRYALEDSIATERENDRAERTFQQALELEREKNRLRTQAAAAVPFVGAAPIAGATTDGLPEALRLPNHNVIVVDEIRRTIELMGENFLSTIDEQIYTDELDKSGQHIPATAREFESQDLHGSVVRKKKLPTGLAKETLRQVADIEKTLGSIDELPRGWFHVGTKWDVPHNACYKGHCGKVYVWVTPDGRESLARFSLAILKLASAFKDPQLVTAPSGIQFSPAVSQQR
jgi:hypothetical protein